jgi:hypothetical protein
MADVSVTATSVQYDVSKNNVPLICGETITAGQPVYTHTDGKAYKADNDDASVAKAVVTGIAVGGGAAGQAIFVQTGGDVNFGAATFTLGANYFLSATAGGICPVADLGAGKSVVFLGTARSTTVLAMPNGGAFCPAIRP